MKNSLLTLFFLIVLVATANAQNKSLGVGTATPNANAALHIESPTNNQGFIMPRLTTAQRTAMGSLLTTSDNGLMLYDTDLKTIYIWDGTKWNTTSQVAGGPKLQYPYRDSITTALGLPMMYLQYNNPNAAGMIYLQRYDTTNVTNPFVVEHFGRGAAMAIYQHYKGTGISAFLDNEVNPNMAIRGTTVGTGAGIQGLNNGTGNGFAGLFSISQPSNTYPAIQANSKGSGSSFRAFQSATDGTGNGFDAYMFNPASSGTGIFVTHQGVGRAGHLIINNPSSTVPALEVETNATSGFGIKSVSTGNEVAGYFETNNPTAASSTLFGLTNSVNGSAIGAVNTANATALAIWQGGMKVSNATLSSGTSIATRAVAYLITGGGPYTFGFTPADGDIFFFYNNTASAVTVGGLSIPPNAGKTVIFLGGALRAL